MSETAQQLSPEQARDFLLQRARERGIGLEVYGGRNTATSVQAFGNEISKFSISDRQGLGLRALVGGSWGYAFTENLSEAALERALKLATENAELVAPEAGAALVAWGEPPELDLYGEGLSGVSTEQKAGVALELERAARETDPRVKSIPYGGYRDSISETLIGNTEGLSRSYRALHAVQFVSPLVSEGGQNKSKVDWQFSREFAELDPTRTAISAVEKSLALLGARLAPSGTFAAIVSGECLGSLISLYAVMFSGKFVEEGKSPLAGRLGEQLGSSQVSLRDDPTLARGMNSRAFDAEGCPSAPLTLLDAGRLCAFMHNQGTAARAGTHSTGHAVRYGIQGTVNVGPSNLTMQPGDSSPEDLMRGFTGLKLTGISGGHAGANPITGDFSLQAEGFWIEDGAVSHPLEVFTVAGNFLELLADVEAVGSEVHHTMSGVSAPDVRVSRLAVGGE